jgi:phage terminase small subunit
MFGLTKLQIQFAYSCAENPSWSATKCAIQAGYSEACAAEMGSENLKRPQVQEAIQDRREQLAARVGITPELVLREWLKIAIADPNKLSRVVHEPCQFCWAMKDDALPPNPSCLACKGVGLSYVKVSDSSKLTGPEKRLYAGAVQTKDGVKVLMRDQDGALKNIADYLGMLNKSKGEFSGPDGGPIPLSATSKPNYKAMSTAELEAMLAAQIAAAQANMGVLEGVSQLELPAGPMIEGVSESVRVP